MQTVSSDAESVEYKNLSFIEWNVGDENKIRSSRCPPETQDSIYVVDSQSTWLRMRMKTVKVQQMQFIDEKKDIRPSIPRNIEWFLWLTLREMSVNSSSCTEWDRPQRCSTGDDWVQGECFSKIGQDVHRWCQREIGWRTDVKFQILDDWVQKRARTQKGKVVKTIVETSNVLTVIERRVRSDVSESHQEEVKKSEEQASVKWRNLQSSQSRRRRQWIPHELSWDQCVQGWSRGENCEVRRRHYQEEDELTQEQYVDVQNWSTFPYHQIQEQRVEVQRVIANQECLQQHIVEYGVSNSSLEFERLSSQERIAERLTKETVSNARQKTLTHTYSTLSWTVRRRQRLSKFQSKRYTDMNVDEKAEMQRQITSTHRKKKVEQVSVSCASGRRHCRVTTTRVNDSKETTVSTLTRRATRVEWAVYRERCTVERQMQRIQKKKLKSQ